MQIRLNDNVLFKIKLKIIEYLICGTSLWQQYRDPKKYAMLLIRGVMCALYLQRGVGSEHVGECPELIC